jgi:hypothetical protein
VRDTYASTWTALTVADVLVNFGAKPGLLEFGSVLGTHEQRVRVTYTGGYFFETLEPEDIGFPTAAPSGSSPLPTGLQLAWLMQTNAWFSQRDSLNLFTTSGNPEQLSARLAAVAGKGLLDDVKEILAAFRRFV